MTERATLDDPERATLFEDPHTVRLALDAGESVPAHEHPDRTVIFAVHDGACDLRLGEESHRLAAGDVLRFDGDQAIEPTATERLRALVVLG